MNVRELLQALRATLQPQGTAQVVRLEAGYYNFEIIKKAIDQLEIMMLTGTEASPLETIGIYALLDSIGYQR